MTKTTTDLTLDSAMLYVRSVPRASPSTRSSASTSPTRSKASPSSLHPAAVT